MLLSIRVCLVFLSTVLFGGTLRAQELPQFPGRFVSEPIWGGPQYVQGISHYPPQGLIYPPYPPPLTTNGGNLELYFPSAYRYYPNILYVTDYPRYPGTHLYWAR
jgi:hypothetical protein